MAVEDANYIDELQPLSPTSGDPVSEGDDQLRVIKKAVQQSFPSVDMAVNAIHASDDEPDVSVATGLIWFDTDENLLKIRSKLGTWITLPISVVTSNTVDINGGTVNDITSLSFDTGSTVLSIDNGDVVTGAEDRLATQSAIKAYVAASGGGGNLTLKGQLLGYSSAEGPFAPGATNKVLVANTTKDFGFEWADVGADSIADESITADKIADATITDAKLSTTGVGALASYTSANITVNPQGRITVASNGTGGSGGATGAGGDEVFWENEAIVTTSYSITQNRNAMSAGPITINSGQTVTVPAGSNWVVV